MNVENTLKVNSLKNSKVIAGKEGLYRQVNGIMVLEAADVEKWGREGQIILTSYYALKDFNEEEIALFFQKINSIGTSAIIIKINKLLNDIPSLIIYYCNLYSIPLIQINKDVKYEALILEILGPLIDRNISLLNRYYDIHKDITALALREPSIEDFLKELKSILSLDVSVINYNKNETYSTNPLCDHCIIVSSYELPKDRYINYKYIRKEVIHAYSSLPEKATQLTVVIPSLYFDSYELIIHEIPSQVNIEDFMVIENAVSFLQMELLKKYAVSQSIFHRKNEIINDLLNGRLYDLEDIDELLDYLGIGKKSKYQIALIQLYPSNIYKKYPNWAKNVLRKINQKVKIYWKDTVFLEKLEKITFLTNFHENSAAFSSSILKDIMEEIKNNTELNDFCYQIAISSICVKEDIGLLSKQVQDTQKILKLFHKMNTILSYDELGIYKLFLESNSLDKLKDFISPKLLSFKEEYPELLETLMIFIENNESFTKTAKNMYLHPKTIRYRIDRIIYLLKIDINDPEVKLQLQIANRLFKLIK